jgi:hypothetical protein
MRFDPKTLMTPKRSLHYGYVGKAAWWSTEGLLHRKAGEAQRAAGTSRPEWNVSPYHGDDPIDYFNIERGFDLYRQDRR